MSTKRRICIHRRPRGRDKLPCEGDKRRWAVKGYMSVCPNSRETCVGKRWVLVEGPWGI